MALLEVEGLRVGYGFPVLMGVSFVVQEGETAVLFGLNGAGKTTTVNCLAGVLPVWGGEIRFDGKKISGKDAPAIVKAGIALSPEGRRVWPGLTVLKNLELGAWVRKDQKGIDETVQQVFSYFPRLDERKDQLAGTLSGGEQQMLAIGRAIMSKPRLLMIDEASLGLSPKLTQTVFDVVHQINQDGTTVLIVEQNAGVLRIASRAFVMEKGTLVYRGSGDEILDHSEIRQAYLGSPA